MSEHRGRWGRFVFWFESVFGSMLFGLLLFAAFIVVLLDATGIW